jgi:hypothetical protein
MSANPTSRFSLLKAIGLFMGASFFAFLLSGFLHETGHYLASTIQGVPIRGIVLDPFGQDYNIYLGDTIAIFATPAAKAFNGAAAPFFDVFIGVMISSLLWRKRSPVLLPLLMVGSTSLLIESVAIIIEFKGIVGSDFGKIVAIGVPPSILVLLAIVMFAAGCIWQLQFLPLAGIRSQDPFWRKLVVFLAGIPVLLLCAVIYQTLFGGDYYVPTWRGYMLMENLRKAKTIELGVSIVLFTVIAALHKPLFPWLDRLSHTPVAQVRWWEALIAIGLGLAITIIQLVYFNDPTIVVR